VLLSRAKSNTVCAPFLSSMAFRTFHFPLAGGFHPIRWGTWEHSLTPSKFPAAVINWCFPWGWGVYLK